MKRKNLPGRVVKRLRRLRERFGKAVRDNQVEHDHDNLTSTRPRHIYLGELLWSERWSLGDYRLYREGSSHLPALVTLEAGPETPVEMAPGRARVPPDISEFCLRSPRFTKGISEQTCFLLPYRRPVERRSIGAPMRALNGRGKQELAEMLRYLRQPGGGWL